MKIRAAITAVKDTGDTLYIEVQGKAIGGAGWRGMKICNFHAPMTARNCKTYFTGRIVYIEITPK